MVRPSSLAGVPGLAPAHCQAQRIKPVAEPDSRRLAHAPRRNARLAHVDEPFEERARGEHRRVAAQLAPAAQDHARHGAVLHEQIFDRFHDDFKIGLGADRRLHMPPVELAVGLRARPLHGRTLGAVQHAELNAGLVNDAAHQPV